MKKIYICFKDALHPQNQNEKLKSYARFIVNDCGGIPVSPYIYFTLFLDPNIKEEIHFISMTEKFLLLECDELWYFGDTITQSMVEEIVLAMDNKIPVKYISDHTINKIKEHGGIIDEL